MVVIRSTKADKPFTGGSRLNRAQTHTYGHLRTVGEGCGCVRAHCIFVST